MEISSLVTIADISQSLTIIISLSAYVPQWLTVYRNKSSENISLKSWGLWVAGGILAWIYAFVNFKVHSTGIVLLLTSSLSVIFLITTFSLVLLYRDSSRKGTLTDAIA